MARAPRIIVSSAALLALIGAGTAAYAANGESFTTADTQQTVSHGTPGATSSSYREVKSSVQGADGSYAWSYAWSTDDSHEIMAYASLTPVPNAAWRSGEAGGTFSTDGSLPAYTAPLYPAEGGAQAAPEEAPTPILFGNGAAITSLPHGMVLIQQSQNGAEFSTADGSTQGFLCMGECAGGGTYGNGKIVTATPTLIQPNLEGSTFQATGIWAASRPDNVRISLFLDGQINGQQVGGQAIVDVPVDHEPTQDEVNQLVSNFLASENGTDMVSVYGSVRAAR